MHLCKIPGRLFFFYFLHHYYPTFCYFYLSITIPFFKRDHQVQFDSMSEEALVNKE